MIRLNPEKDKNKFSIFLKVGDELICFKYSTIIFGFNASPSIQNFVLKHLAERFPTDSGKEIYRNNLYVDNLCYTSNSTKKLILLHT